MELTAARSFTPTPWAGPPAGPGEIQSAERVQQHMRPRHRPRLGGLEVAGACLPGRALGGDFYDVLQPTPDRLVLILGDVSGHDLSASLMAASLQANIRAHYALSAAGLQRRIASINRLFFECTASEHYAALFVGEYDDGPGVLRFANCGHVAPWLVRAGGGVERLGSTGTPVGLFERWNGAIHEIAMGAGDIVVLATDGIVEAPDRGEGEFGDLRLLSVIQRYRHLSPQALIRAIARDVRLTCARRPADDATVVVARRAEQPDGGDGGG